MRYRSAVTRGAIVLGALALISCPLADRETEPQGPSPAVVVSTQPSDGAAGIAVTTPVSAVFDIDMRGSTFTAESFTLCRGPVAIDGAVAYDSAARTASFTPSADLEHEAEYTAKISTAARDAAGKALAADVEWRFTTVAADAAAALVFDPAGGVFENDLTVTISSATPDATIYFETTSGTIAAPPPDPDEPSTASTPYAAGIAVSGQGTVFKIKAVAVKDGMRTSATTSAQFTVDASAFTAKWGTAVWDLHKWNP